jgi:Uma2 family endonuclease
LRLRFPVREQVVAMSAPALTPPKVVDYPEQDGNLMADNTLQYEYIVSTRLGLDDVFADDPNVFVAADLLWYPVEGENTIRQAPDVMVIIGRPKGRRGSYRQWEENHIAPQVVFEILSPGNRQGEMTRKALFYQNYGVEEYYLYDPDDGTLEGWRRQGGQFREIPKMQGWESPLLKVKFEVVDGELRLFRPDGRRFATYEEHVQLGRQLEFARQQAEQERQRADQEKQRADQEKQRADQEKQRADETLAELERLRAELKKRDNPPPG